MKKLIFPLVAMLLCMASCQKENGILYLITETYSGDAKLHLDSENFAVWDNNDKVLVNGTEYSVAVGSGNATITGVPAADSYTALYPASWATGSTTLNIPGMQTYREDNGVQIIDAPMFAYSNGSTLEFHNLGSILAVTVNNETGSDLTVVSIDVTAQGADLCGTATISNTTSEAPVMRVSGNNAVTLYCNTTIAANGFKEFYISLPPITASGLTITVNNDTMAYSKTRSSSITLGRSAGQRVEFSTSTATVAPHSAPLPNQIWYTATKPLSGSIATEGYGANYVSISHSNALGVITFDGPISTIPSSAFYGINNARKGKLTSITLPANVTTVGDEAFMECESLASVIMPGVTHVGSYALSCHALQNVSLPCLLNIGEGAFSWSSLASVTIPNATNVGKYAFSNCESLTSISLPKAVTIKEDAFAYCDALISVSIPNVTQIESYGFDECTSLTTVYADNIANLGNAAFQGCTSLADFYSNTAAPTMNGIYIFYNVPGTAVLHLPASCQGATWNQWPGTYSYDR